MIGLAGRGDEQAAEKELATTEERRQNYTDQREGHVIERQLAREKKVRGGQGGMRKPLHGIVAPPPACAPCWHADQPAAARALREARFVWEKGLPAGRQPCRTQQRPPASRLVESMGE